MAQAEEDEPDVVAPARELARRRRSRSAGRASSRCRRGQSSTRSSAPIPGTTPFSTAPGRRGGSRVDPERDDVDQVRGATGRARSARGRSARPARARRARGRAASRSRRRRRRRSAGDRCVEPVQLGASAAGAPPSRASSASSRLQRRVQVVDPRASRARERRIVGTGSRCATTQSAPRDDGADRGRRPSVRDDELEAVRLEVRLERHDERDVALGAQLAREVQVADPGACHASSRRGRSRRRRSARDESRRLAREHPLEQLAPWPKLAPRVRISRQLTRTTCKTARRRSRADVVGSRSSSPRRPRARPFGRGDT